MFTANVVNFLNSNPNMMSFEINEVVPTADYIDIDIDVSITHPFPGYPQYNGYDVRGVFMGEGSGTLSYNPDVIYPVDGLDQMMLTDPDDGFGGPDGYTRWYNVAEFSEGGMPLFNYTEGKLATPGFAGTATINPYKYFADGLGDTEDLWDWLVSHPNSDGQFSAGATNTRNYYLRFPNTAGVVYGYAIIANWEGPEQENHPSNAPESLALSVVDSSDMYFDSTASGGNLIFDINVWNWDAEVISTVMEDYTLIVESSVLSAPYIFNTTDMTPTGGGDYYSSFHVEIPADNITGTDSNDCWIMVEQADDDYTNDLGQDNLAGTDPLTAYFHYPVEITGEPPVEEYGWVRTWGAGFQDRVYDVEIDSEGNIYACGFFYYNCDFDPDEEDEFFLNSGGNRDSFLAKYDPEGDFLWAGSWGGNVTFGGMALGLTIDHSDNIIVCGYFYGEDVDFDPGPGEDLHSSHKDPAEDWGSDCYITKFAPDGTHLWARTWGGYDWIGDSAAAVEVDSVDNIYIAASFRGTCDFDPDPVTEDIHSSIDDYRDPTIISYTSDGDYRWMNTWGAPFDDWLYGIAVDSNNDIYVSGAYHKTCDFDPGIDEEIYDADIDGRSYFSKYDSDGNYIRVRIFNAGTPTKLDVNSADNLVVGGNFGGTAQFDPDGGLPEVVANGERDNYISMFEPDGSIVFAESWDGIAAGDSTGGFFWEFVCVDDDDNIYYSGHFTGTADLDPDPVDVDEHISGGSRDAFVTKFDPTGDLIWSRSWGGESLEDGAGLGVDSVGNVYIGGYYYSDECDFDPGPEVYSIPQNGNGDCFLLKLFPDGYW